nr:uncharacterized protein LOC113711381 [Coffea arabica]
MVKAFSCKLWWKLRQRRSIWAEYMFSKYIGDQHPSQAVALRPKGAWKRLIGIRDMAEASISWSLGPGMVDFWLDTWCEQGPLQSLVVADGDRPHFLVAEFMGREGWNKERLLQWLPLHLVEMVMEIPFDLEGQDQIMWSPSSSAGFSLSSAWESCRRRQGRSPMHGMVWNRGVMLKMSMFSWRLLRSFVPVDSVIRQRGIPFASRCSCCLEEEESVLHLFVNGPVATEVWGRFGNRFGVGRRPIEGLESLWKKWAASLPRLPVSHIRCILPVLIWWFLWKGRNKARFEGQTFSAQQVSWEVDNFIQDMGRAGRLRKAQFYGDMEDNWARLASPVIRHRRPIVVSWHRPPAHRSKLNTDASVINGRATGGGVLRDSEGRLIFAFYKEFGEKGVLGAEALALQEGLRECVTRGVQGVLVEVDSAALVSLVNSSALGGWVHCNLLRRIRRLLRQVVGTVTHIYREANMVADRLAALQGGPSSVFESVQQLPRDVRGCLAMDAREFPSIRLVPG